MEIDSDESHLLIPNEAHSISTPSTSSSSSDSSFDFPSNTIILNSTPDSSNYRKSTIPYSAKAGSSYLNTSMEVEQDDEDFDPAPLQIQSEQAPLEINIQSEREQKIDLVHEEEEEEEEEQREFRFDIQNDRNLQQIINNNLSAADRGDLNVSTTFAYNMSTGDDINRDELTSEYILSKLYNYMKIAEMPKYGTSVFETTFSAYLPYLTEADLFKLSTSYWCNGEHFNCMVSHRGDIIKSNTPKPIMDYMYNLEADDDDDDDIDINNNNNDDKYKTRLDLEITDELLDTAMQSGASVDKIEAMLLQKRIDDGIKLRFKINNNNTDNISSKCQFYQTRKEKDFYLRNLKHRFWNHEVLVRVFIQNGWLTPDLADKAMKTFIKTIYHRVLESKLNAFHSNNRHNHNNHGRRRYQQSHSNKKNVKFSENFLHSFFVSYFCLDDIPKMYKQEIQEKINQNEQYISPQISEETLRRWCELIELLASRGANITEYSFKKCIPLQYALQIGKNTYKIISCPKSHRNKHFIPKTYDDQNIIVPDDIWDVLISYL